MQALLCLIYIHFWTSVIYTLRGLSMLPASSAVGKQTVRADKPVFIFSPFVKMLSPTFVCFYLHIFRTLLGKTALMGGGRFYM